MPLVSLRKTADVTIEEAVESAGSAPTNEATDPAVLDRAAEQGSVEAEVTGRAAQEAALTYRGTHVVARPLPQPGPMVALTLPDALDFGEAEPASADEARVREQVVELAAANQRARAQSVKRLAEWFPGYDFDAASRTTDDRRFAALQIGSALFEHLNALDTIESILATRDLPGNRIQFSHGTKQGRPHRATDPHRPQMQRVRVGPLVDALDEQWTTILNGVDATDPVLAGVIEHLERVYGCGVNTNVYISWGDARGFGPHWDQHDTIIVQATGTKRWKVFEPTALSPLRPWVSDEVSPRPVWEGEISPGMCLLIPRGWGHEVLGSDDMSLHYTIGINRITVQDAIARLSSEGGFHPLFRADLAYDPNGAVHSYDRSVLDGDASLADAVSELATPALIERAIASYRARMPMRMFPRLFDAWVAAGTGDFAGAVVRMPAPAGIHLISIGPNGVGVGVDDHAVDLSLDAFGIVVQLADAAPHQVDSLTGDPATRDTVLAELIRAGLLDVSLG